SGNRFHRSRVIAWPYRDEMDLRLARWQPNWSGWGPGVVEGCLAPFMARHTGAMRLAAIMQSVVVNTLTIADLEARQSSPDLGAALRARLEFIKWCRDYMSDSLPIIATDEANKFGSLSHNVAGIDKLIGAQRQFLLDVLEYPAVVLFGDSVGGMNGGDRQGEWRSWARTVAARQKSWVWTAGMFGGGLRQAVSLAMLAQRGPTNGRLDPTVTPTWPSILTETADDAASMRLKHAQARAQDALVLGLTPSALLRHDPDVKERYPSLDVDEGPLPELDPTAPMGPHAPGSTTALQPQGEAPTATTPGATNEALATAQQQPDGGAPAEDATPPAPLVLPDDIRTEKEVAAALAMTPAAFRKWVEAAKVTTYPTPPGTRGGHRYSLGEVLRAWQTGAIRRADAAARMDDAAEERRLQRIAALLRT
ncbi:MAG TPA: anti-CBASS Acb1 family protein, partial [Nannocystis sp.]